MTKNSGKFYPPSSGEIAKMLGLEPEGPPPVVEPISTIVPTGLPIEAEIVTGNEAETQTLVVETEREYEVSPSFTVGTKAKKMAVIATSILPYIAVFAVGLVAYYFFFADGVNIPSFKKEEISIEEQEKLQKQAAIAQLKIDESSKYVAWISQFYFDVSDEKILEMDRIANNKLTNFENYLLQLNPKNYDTLLNGNSDAQNILNGINPKTGKSLSDTERDIIAKYFDLEVIRERVQSLPNTTDKQVVGSSGVQGLPPGISSATPENRLSVNTDIPGRLEVPSIGVNTPIIWTQNSADFDTDLRKGIVHYPGTPYPGSLGTSYISGHSSNYAWVRADFNRIFEKLNELPNGATFKITVVGPNGKNIWLHYIVEHKQEFEPEDQAQFTNTADSIVALSTCWPINTTDKRLVAFGKLSRVEYE